MSVLKIRCKNCREKGVPRNNSTIGYFCDKPECSEAKIAKALEKGRAALKKQVKETNKEWNDHVKKVSPSVYSKKYKKELQNEINKLARMIDAYFGITTCICCNRGFGAQCDACHFHSVGSNHSLRYNLHNLHSGNSGCNQYSATHKTGYIAGLEARYGKEYLEMVQGLQAKYPEIKLSEVEVVDKLKLVRKLIRHFDGFTFESPIQARKLLNDILGIYK